MSNHCNVSNKYDSNYKPDIEKLPDPQNTLNIEGSNTSIQKVGIRNFKIPFNFRTRDDDNILSLQTKVSAYVSLNDNLKGINMSRLSRTLYNHNKDGIFILQSINNILDDFHNNLNSDDSYIKFRFEYPYEQTSLRSNLVGVKYYDCVFEGKMNNGIKKYFMTVNFEYSSTCPCSQELSEHAREERGIKAAPHSQRSVSTITVQLDVNNTLWIEELIDVLRDTLKTETQLLVKREDEQAFAELSGLYPKFVEDSARLIYQQLNNNSKILDFVIVCNHYESLHSSDAVSIMYKGIDSGLK